jgi:hypothetical protein
MKYLGVAGYMLIVVDGVGKLNTRIYIHSQIFLSQTRWNHRKTSEISKDSRHQVK